MPIHVELIGDRLEIEGDVENLNALIEYIKNAIFAGSYYRNNVLILRK
jgi:hypothetical protein